MRIFCWFFCLLVSGLCQAELVVNQAVIRLLPATVANTSVYFSISNTGVKSQDLVAASSAIADKIELHNHVMQGEVMKMVQQHSVPIPAGTTVEFAPGGLHLMVFGLHAPLKPEQKVKFTLTTADGQSVAFEATAKRPGVHGHHH